MALAIENQSVRDTGQKRSTRKVLSYTQTLDGSAHAALDSINTDVVFDTAKSVYVVEPPIESLNDEAEREAGLFAEALKSYELEAPKKYKTGVNIDQLHSIGDVVKQIDSALAEYKNGTEKAIWESLRKGFWKLCDSEDKLQNWLQLLPSQSAYCSLIFGGLNLIIKAAGRIGDVRNEAFAALAEIPFHLESTTESVGIFSKSESLRKCGVRLFTVTLAALGHILRWFKKRAVGKAFAAFLKQDSYQKQLSEKIEEIQIISTRFKNISMVCMQREVVGIHKTLASVAVATDNSHSTIKSKIAETNQTLEHLRLSDTTQHRNTQKILEAEFEDLKTRYDAQFELNQKNANALNDLTKLLESVYVALPLCFPSKQERLPSYEKSTKDTKGPKLQTGLLSPNIFSRLNNENNFSQTDLRQSLRGLSTLTRSEEDRAVWTMKSPVLRSWLLSTTSSTLFINGSCPSTRARSPITFVCARLIDSLVTQDKENFIILHFFCGQHISSATDSRATPLGLMTNLLAQLRLQYSGFEVSDQDLADANTLDNVIYCFKELVEQLEANMMVFCIIDGISMYEDAARLAETRKVMHELTELAAAPDAIGPVFKLLMTSPTRTKNLPERVAKNEVLRVPRDVPAQAGLSVLRNGKIRQEMS